MSIETTSTRRSTEVSPGATYAQLHGAAALEHVNVIAHKWDGGWELWIAGTPVSQAKTLSKAAQQIRDYLDTVHPETDHSAWRVVVTPALGGLGAYVAEARSAARSAAQSQAEAARLTREIVERLHDAGFSAADSASILGISKGRVSRLLADK